MATQKSSQDINNHGIEYTVRCRYNTIDFLQDTYKIHPKAHPLGRVMGCFCEFKFWFAFYFTAVMYTTSCYIWPRYNGTQLYMLSGYFTFLAHGIMKCWEMKKYKHEISRSQALKNHRFESNLSKITRPAAAIKSLRFALLFFHEIRFAFLPPQIHYSDVTWAS